MSDDAAAAPFPGFDDAGADGSSLAEHFRRHADAIECGNRSPLCAALMRGAAVDIEARGPVADLFAGIPVPSGSVPTLRLLGALHHLVLSGRAPRLAAYYPSAGGDRSPDGAWPVARAVIADEAGRLRGRLGRTVQTNEPGRAAVLYPALLWLARRHGLPVRLLEIGASAGLNLMTDRFCYRVGGLALGAPDSPVHFAEPWQRVPDLDLAEAAGRLRIIARKGCDLAPLDPRDPEDRLTALSYIWPDEAERFQRTRAALELVAKDPPRVVAQAAEAWLPPTLAAAESGQLTVIWQSVVRQYVPAASWAAIERAFDGARTAAQQQRRPVVWLSMEADEDHVRGFRLTIRDAPGRPERLLARCGDHGPPVIWEASAE